LWLRNGFELSNSGDLAKAVFQIHAVDERGKTVMKKQLKRDQVAAFFANLPPCLIGSRP